MESSILCLYDLHRVCGKCQDCNALSTGVCLIKLLNIACVWETRENCEVSKRKLYYNRTTGTTYLRQSDGIRLFSQNCQLP
jgi:hypothetical protein